MCAGRTLIKFYQGHYQEHYLPQKGQYCLGAIEWKLSQMCQMLGVLSVLSVQTSVMSLGVLSTYRMIIVVRPHSTDTTR